MMWCFSRKKGSALGIDIGSAAVKIVRLTKSARGLRVEQCATGALPPGAVHDHRMTNPAAVGAVIRQLCGAAESCAVVAIPSALVMTKQLNFPVALSEIELELHVSMQAEGLLPHAQRDLAIDWTPLPATNSDGGISVRLVACRQEHVDERVQALHHAGLRASAVTLDVQMVQRAIRAASLHTAPVALVDLGATNVSLYVLSEGVVVHRSDQASGYGEQGGAVVTVDDSSGVGATLSGFHHIALNLQRSLRAFHASHPSLHVSSLLLAGGGALNVGLPDCLSRVLEIPVSEINPFAGMRNSAGCTEEDFSHRALYLHAAALAMRGLQDD